MILCEYCDTTSDGSTSTCPNCGAPLKLTQQTDSQNTTETASQTAENAGTQSAGQTTDENTTTGTDTADTLNPLKTIATAAGAIGASLLGGLLTARHRKPPMPTHTTPRHAPRMNEPHGMHNPQPHAPNHRGPSSHAASVGKSPMKGHHSRPSQNSHPGPGPAGRGMSSPGGRGPMGGHRH